MMEAAHDFSQRSTIGVTAHLIWRFICSECNWTHLIATAGALPLQQCPWCGWEEIEPQQVGAFASFICSEHGRVTCIITDENIRVNDFMDLFCPHCRVVSRGRPGA